MPHRCKTVHLITLTFPTPLEDTGFLCYHGLRHHREWGGYVPSEGGGTVHPTFGRWGVQKPSWKNDDDGGRGSSRGQSSSVSTPPLSSEGKNHDDGMMEEGVVQEGNFPPSLLLKICSLPSHFVPTPTLKPVVSLLLIGRWTHVQVVKGILVFAF